jgi:hypothetical protein
VVALVDPANDAKPRVSLLDGPREAVMVLLPLPVFDGVQLNVGVDAAVTAMCPVLSILKRSEPNTEKPRKFVPINKPVFLFGVNEYPGFVAEP